MKHRRHFRNANDVALREAARIGALISDLDRRAKAKRHRFCGKFACLFLVGAVAGPTFVDAVGLGVTSSPIVSLGGYRKACARQSSPDDLCVPKTFFELMT
jgi:hypothetical protein